MLDLTYEQLMAGLKYDEDIRLPPDERRQVIFRVGWEDATIRHKQYTARTLKRLTWCNLGYRMGQRFGPWAEGQITNVYQVLAVHYQRPKKRQ